MAIIDSTTPQGVQPNGFSAGYTLVMSDEFNSSTLDGKWVGFRDFADHTAITAYDLNNAGNSLLRMWWNGNTATDNQIFASVGSTPFRTRYGFFEARVKCIRGRGFFPGFWLYPLSNALGENADGAQQELDIVEWFSSENTDWLVDTSLFQCKNAKLTIWPEGGGGATTANPPAVKLSDFGGYRPTISTAYHTYGLRWTAAQGLQWYFDGVAIGAAIPDPWGAANNQQLPVFLQLWWGPNGGNPTPDGNTPQGPSNSMEWDYVRVWSVGAAPPPPVSISATATAVPAMSVTFLSASYATGSTINGNASYEIRGQSIQNVELLNNGPGTYIPSYGTFTLAPDAGGGPAAVVGTFNWNTTTLSNGPITVHVSAFSSPPGGGGSEILAAQYDYIINNVTASISATASAADRDMQFIFCDLDLVPRPWNRRYRR